MPRLFIVKGSWIAVFLIFALKGAKTAGMKDDAARQLIAAAVICDWYGDYDNAVKFVKKAASLAQDEKVKNLAEALFLD